MLNDWNYRTHSTDFLNLDESRFVYKKTHEIRRDYRQTFSVINFLRMIHFEIILKEFTLAHYKENEDQFHKLQGRGLFSQEMTNKMKTQFQCRHLREGRRLRVRQCRWVCTVGQQISELQLDKFPNPQSFLVWKIRFKNQATTCSDFHRKQRCGSKKWRLLIHWTNLNPRDPFLEGMLDAGRADCFCSEQSHQEFTIQEEGQSRGTESQERGPVSSRKRDRFHDLRPLSYSVMLIYFLLLFVVMIFRISIQDGMKVYHLVKDSIP